MNFALSIPAAAVVRFPLVWRFPLPRLLAARREWLGLLSLCALLALGALPSPGTAQATGRVMSRFSASAALLDTQPLGGLKTGPGVGLAGSVAWALDPARVVRLRAEFRGAIYGMDRREFCLSQPIGCWIHVSVNTTYSSVFFGGGPELALPLGRSEIVLDATAGLGYFGVSSSLDGVSGGGDGVFDTSHFHDTFLAWSTGGELRLPVYRQVSLALGTHYQHNGRVSYVREGDITQNGDGTLDVRSTTTDANMIAITLGVAFRPFSGPRDGGGR